MADSQDTATTKGLDATNSIPTAQELLDAQAKWWQERYEQAQEAQGWSGRNLMNQSELINMCMGMEQDITFLLKYVRSLTEHIDMVATDKDAL